MFIFLSQARKNTQFFMFGNDLLFLLLLGGGGKNLWHFILGGVMTPSHAECPPGVYVTLA